MASNKMVKELCERIGVGRGVADELLTLGGDDIDLVVEASLESPGLDQCKAKIINKRFMRLENSNG